MERVPDAARTERLAGQPFSSTARDPNVALRLRGATFLGHRIDAVAEETIIREFREDDLGAIVEFSLRAWEPVFGSVRNALGDDIFLRLHPDWKEDQADAVRSACTNEERDVFVAVRDGRPVGFVAVALNAFHEGMGVIDIIGVDPAYQRRGISSRLTVRDRAHAQPWYGHRRRGDGRRPGTPTGAGGVRGGGVHALAHRSVFPAP